MADEEVGRDGDRRRGRDRLLVDDAGDRDPPRHPGPLGEQNAAEDVEDAARHVAGEQRLAPGDLGLDEADPVAEEAQDQVPAQRAERVEDRQHHERRDQPEDVEAGRPPRGSPSHWPTTVRTRKPKISSAMPSWIATRTRRLRGGRLPILRADLAEPVQDWLACPPSGPCTLDAEQRVDNRADGRVRAAGQNARAAAARPVRACGSAAATTRPSPCPGAPPPPRSTPSSTASTSSAPGRRCAASATRRSPPRSPTSPRWAPSRARPTWSSASPPDLDEDDCLELLEGIGAARRARPGPRSPAAT